MAAQQGGIALLSLYNDDDDDDDEDHNHHHHPTLPPPVAVDEVMAEPPDQATTTAGTEAEERATPPELGGEAATAPLFASRSSPLSDEETGDKTLPSPVARSPTPSPLLPRPWAQIRSPFDAASPAAAPPLAAQRPSLDSQKMRGGPLGIVYGEDEAAMSPEPEEGEILANASFMLGVESQFVDVAMDERMLPGNAHALRSGVETGSPEAASLVQQSKSKTILQMNLLANENEEHRVEESDAVSRKGQNDDPLSKFLPPSPSVVEDPEKLQKLQDKINKFLLLKKAGKSFNAELRNRKDYRNPDFLQHAVRYQDIDQTGTCFSKDVFDPHGYDKSDFYDAIEKDMRRDAERKEQERKNSQKVDFISSGIQHVNALTSKMNTQNPGTLAPTTVALPGAVAIETVGKDRQSKKTKWDKVDGDPIISGVNDNSTAGMHAAHFSASNAGGGYSAFALHKRKEVEEKRSSDRKLDKRS